MRFKLKSKYILLIIVCALLVVHFVANQAQLPRNIKTTGERGDLLSDSTSSVVSSGAPSMPDKEPEIVSSVRIAKPRQTKPSVLDLNRAVTSVELITQDQDTKFASPVMRYSRIADQPLTSCVTDNLTGLVWEGKESEGVRAGSNRYLHSKSDAPENLAMTHTGGYVAYVNRVALCGFTDWRLPSLSELMTLTVVGPLSNKPTIEMDWFPNTDATWYWTSSVPEVPGDFSWTVFFGSGRADMSNQAYPYGNALRLVRARGAAL